jgi:hypothetical protein
MSSDYVGEFSSEDWKTHLEDELSMKKKVIDLQPGDVLRLHTGDWTIKGLQYQKDNVRVRISFKDAGTYSIVRGQFEELEVVA